MIDNVEVDGSHCGLVWNPAVLKVVADRLSQAPETWCRYGANVQTAAGFAATAVN
jgi:hypothetical protein